MQSSTDSDDLPALFDESQAATYDSRFEKLARLRDALQLVTRLVLSSLPDNAHVLCVGAGTGAELLYLAEAYPGWRFTAVDPSGPMLKRCRARAEKAGIASRCEFHEGIVADLNDEAVFDGATALLVSQFVMDETARTEFFQAISNRLRPGAPLMTADLATDSLDGPLMELWKRAWLHADIPAENVALMREMLGRAVAVLPPADVAALIEAGGFEAPLLCFQTLMIHGWTATKR